MTIQILLVFSDHQFDTSDLLGSRICVRLSFNLFQPATFEVFKEQITSTFSELYAEHKWLRMDDEDRDRFDRMVNKRPTDKELIEALLFLTNLLHAHFNAGKPFGTHSKVVSVY
jgi:hypothetical protein